MNDNDEIRDGEAAELPADEVREDAPMATLAPGVDSLGEAPDEGVPEDEQEDPYEGRDLPGLTPAEEPWEDEEDEEDTAVEAAPPAEPAPPAEGPTSPWPRRGGAGTPDAPAAPDERSRYWRRVLTGDPATVPDDVRARAVADDAGDSDEEREYRMLSTINRSWLADHSEASREEIRATWPQQRAGLARRLGAADNERELFTALSMEERDAPRREAGRAIYEKSWRAGLMGGKPLGVGADIDKLDAADVPFARGIATSAYTAGSELRRRYLPLAQRLAEGLDAFASMEEDVLPAVRVVPAAPQLSIAVQVLAELEPDQRHIVYAIAQGLMKPQADKVADEGLLMSARRAVGRGAYNSGLGVAKLLGNMGSSMLGALGRTVDDTFGTDFEGSGAAMDRRTRVFDEVQQLYQGQLAPLDVSRESGLAGQMLVDAAGAVPAAIMSCCGGAGFATLWASGAGESVAEARRLAPEGDQRLQLAAGMVGSSLQAAIFIGMGRLGGRMLENTLSRFSRAAGKGAGAYTMAGLATLGGMSRETASLLLAGKAAQLSDKATQELAARLGGTASNIDWQAYGDNLTDIETNMREAAMTLPFVLIGSGRVALRHFRSPRSVLGEGHALEDWGIDPGTRRRIMEESDIDRQGELLRDALAGSRRWSAPGFIFEAMKALRLLNTDYFQGFKDRQVVADFLKLPSEGAQVPRPPLVERSAQDEADVRALVRKHGTGESSSTHRLGLALKLWDEWWQRAHVVSPLPGETVGEGQAGRIEAAAQRRRFFHDDLWDDTLAIAPRLRPSGFYAPQAEAERMALLRDRVAEATDLSYQLLLHAYTLDSLTHNSMGIDRLRNNAERTRRDMLGALARSVVNRALGQPGAAALGEFGQQMADYFSRRSTRSMAPNWLRRLAPPFLRGSVTRAHELAGVADTGEPLELQELYRVELGLLSCANALYELLPMTPDFQTALSRGMTPAQAYAHLLGREFELDLAGVDKFPHEALASIENRTDMEAWSARNAQDFARYSMLTGSGLESVTGDDGATCWRARRPNGRPTRWHSEQAQAINDLVANSSLLFMPFGLDTARLRQQQAGEPSFDLAAAAEGGPWTFTAFDQLCNTAVRDLSQRWLETGTGIMPGFGRAELRSYFYIGGKVDTDVPDKLVEVDRRAPLREADALSLATPLGLARARYHTYWWRQLGSGLLTAQEAGDALADGGIITPGERERILGLTRESRQFLQGRNRARLLSVADTASIHDELAAHLADMTLGYLLRHLDDVPLPASAREWFASAALSPLRADMPETYRRLNREEAAIWSNRRDAQALRALAPRFAATLADGGAGIERGPLGRYLREALGQDPAQAYEQGWSLTRMGRDFLGSMAQDMWNLFLHPAQAWERMEGQAREKLADALAELLPGVEPESALRELDAVLQEQPGLHAYEAEPGGQGRVRRIELAEAEEGDALDPPEYEAVPPYGSADGGTGFRLGDWEPVPETLRQDPRTLPALRLLGALRAYATRHPFSWGEGGIRWKGRQYGNRGGLKPPGVPDEWKYDTPLRGFMEMLALLDARVPDSDGKVPRPFGVDLGGHGAATDLTPLQNISIYRDPRNPSHIVRLMPGEPNSATEKVRRPYVVHSAAGAYMDSSFTLRDNSRMDSTLVPLDRFHYNVPRISRGESIAPRAEYNISHTLDTVLSSTMRMSGLATPGSGIVGMRELLLRFVEDTGLASFLHAMEPHELSYGHILALGLARRMFDCVCSSDPQGAYRRYVKMSHSIRRSGRKRGELLRALLESAQELFDMGDPLRPRIRYKRRSDYEKVYRWQRSSQINNSENLRFLREWSRRNPDY